SRTRAPPTLIVRRLVSAAAWLTPLNVASALLAALGGGGLRRRRARRLLRALLRPDVLGLDGRDDGAVPVEIFLGDPLHRRGVDGEDARGVAAVLVVAEAVALVERQRRRERGAALERDLVRADEVFLGAVELDLADRLVGDAVELGADAGARG